MAQIVVGEHAGACFGVDRALGLVRQALDETPGDVCTLGPLIHNPRVIDSLEGEGVLAVSEPGQAAGKTLVLRAHGVTPHEARTARAACARVVDGTCPFVTRVHRSVEELDAAGYQVVIVGEAGHPEVEGTRAHAQGALVVGDAGELAHVALDGRVGVVAQTTQTRANLRAVVDAILAMGSVRDLRVRDTICSATSERQQSAADLAARSDVMVVIGGHTSANTKHLAEICAARTTTHHVESAADLRSTWFDDVSTVGVTAGASTPQEQIDEVVLALRALMGGRSW